MAEGRPAKRAKAREGARELVVMLELVARLGPERASAGPNALKVERVRLPAQSFPREARETKMEEARLAAVTGTVAVAGATVVTGAVAMTDVENWAVEGASRARAKREDAEA